MCEGVHISSVSGLTLTEYAAALNAHCSSSHVNPPCTGCSRCLKLIEIVYEQGYCMLPEAYRLVSGDVKYTAEHARRKLIQMPLVAICIGDPITGHAFTILMEKFSGTDYSKFGAILNGLVSVKPAVGDSLRKSVVKMLLSVAQSDHERNCLRYAIYCASGMTPTDIRRKYGFQGMAARASEVDEALSEIQHIREAIHDLASVEDRALLEVLGIPPESNYSSSSEADEDLNSEPLFGDSLQGILDSVKDIPQLLFDCHYNWFEFMDCVVNQEEDILSLSKSLFQIWSCCG